MNTTYNITVSSKLPVTVWYNGHGVVPSRTIAYRTVSKIQTQECSRYGVIMYGKKHVPVKSTRANPTGQWSQWEAVQMVDPMSALLASKHLTEVMETA